MLLSIWLPQEFTDMKNGDPGRIAAQVVSGIGFLGAGAIIRLGNNIKGLTTAASLWFIAAIGLAIGAGMFLAAGAAELLGLLTLFALDILEKRIFPSERMKILEVFYKTNNPDTEKALDILKTFAVRIVSEDFEQSVGKSKNSRLRLFVCVPDVVDIARLARELKKTGEITRVEIKEKY
jgi:putative Mg2+ transporter-C (MgtC) family protein